MKDRKSKGGHGPSPKWEMRCPGKHVSNNGQWLVCSVRCGTILLKPHTGTVSNPSAYLPSSTHSKDVRFPWVTLYTYGWTSWWWHSDMPKTRTGWRNILRISCATSWFFFTRLYRDAGSTKHKKKSKLLSWVVFPNYLSARGGIRWVSLLWCCGYKRCFIFGLFPPHNTKHIYGLLCFVKKGYRAGKCDNLCKCKPIWSSTNM